MRSYPKGKPAAHGIFNSLPRSHPRGESNWKLERISLERLFVYFLRVVLRLNFNEHSPRGPCIIHGFSLLNYCGICLAKSFYHSRKTRCLRYVDLMQTSISYTQLEVTVLSRDLPAFASPYCDKKSTNSNLVLCVFRPPAQPKWITQNQGHIMWVCFGSSQRFTKGVYRKLICQANNIKVYFGLQYISPGSITIEDKLLWQP